MGATAHNSRYFVGIRFASPHYVRGVRISRDARYTEGTDNRYSGSLNVYVTRASRVPNASFTTDPSLWELVGVIPPRSNRGYFWYEFPGVLINASGIILEMPGAAEEAQAIDELKVYAFVSYMHTHACVHAISLCC
jgi:hypothetical protein